MSVPEQLDEIVRRVVSRFEPEKMVLFGSLARGEGRTGSDADLLVVMPVAGSRREQATEIELALTGIEMPVDLIVVTPEDIEKHRQQKGSVVRSAIEEGRVLYERPG